jgi:hypothetical protein
MDTVPSKRQNATSDVERTTDDTVRQPAATNGELPHPKKAAADPDESALCRWGDDGGRNLD